MSWPEDRVLVVAITRRSDLRRAREEGWYRIPVARMPRGVAAEHLAFFTGARVIGREKGGIYASARVTGVELLRRRDLLPLEWQRANDLYYRVQLEDWRWREPPLLNPERRAFAFIHSTWDRYCQARRISDLTRRAPGFVPRERPLMSAAAHSSGRAESESRLRRRPAVRQFLMDDDSVALPAPAR
ncbi:MAG: hypothetical protein J4G17_05930 [Anaerolineae bacterium]|nr:hypothetical protein [Anaerolineae bacterium]